MKDHLDFSAEEAISRSEQLIEQGRSAENQDLLAVAVRDYPDSATIAVRYASTLGSRPDSEAAAAEWAMRAASLAPADPVVLLQSAALLLGLGEVDKARDRLEQFRDLGDDALPWAHHAAHLVGRVAWKQGKLGVAEETLRLVFEEEPEVPGHASVLVRFYEEQGRQDEAAAVARVGLEHFPDDQTLLPYAESDA